MHYNLTTDKMQRSATQCDFCSQPVCTITFPKNIVTSIVYLREQREGGRGGRETESEGGGGGEKVRGRKGRERDRKTEE